MRFGANTFIWASPFTTTTDLYLCDLVKEMGFDLLEVAVEDPALIDPGALRRAADTAGIGLTICGAFGPGRSLSSPDPDERDNAAGYLRWCIEAAAEVGSPLVCGPMYAAVGKPRLETEGERQAEWERAVAGLRRWGSFAAERGVRLACEPLNRFETDMVNIVEQGLALVEEVGSPAVGLHLDTFHMHVEEKDLATAIRRAGPYLFHVHACENDRGVPGTGQVDWSGMARALYDVEYQGAVVIESFNPGVKSIARAVCIWREIAPSQNAIAAQGLTFLKKLFAREAGEA